MCLIVRLKAHTMYFKTVNIWSTCGQHMLTKSCLNTHLEKVKIAILQYLFNENTGMSSYLEKFLR